MLIGCAEPTIFPQLKHTRIFNFAFNWLWFSIDEQSFDQEIENDSQSVSI